MGTKLYYFRSNTLYWGEDNSGGSIKQSNLDGSDVVTLLEGLRPGQFHMPGVYLEVGRGGSRSP